MTIELTKFTLVTVSQLFPGRIKCQLQFFFLSQHHALEALGTRKRCPELAAYGNVKIQSLYFVKAAVSCPLTMVSVMRASIVFTVRIQRFPDRTIKPLYYKNRS